MKCDIPYVHSYRDRHGKLRHYFRRKGINIALPGIPGSFEFTTALTAAMERAKETPTIGKAPARGSLKAACEAYYASAEYTNLAKTTQREMRYCLEAICRSPNKDGSQRGDNPIVLLERKHILSWRDKLKDKPGAANKMVRTIRVLLSFAADRSLIDENPALGIKMLKVGWYRDWTDEELEQFEAHWPLGTTERTGYALALYTAQRRADVAQMKWADIAGNTIRVRQQKTGTTIAVPIHPTLAEALTVTPHRADTILAGATGNPLNVIYFGKIMANAIEAAGLPQECVLHGLRKTAARIIAETGGKVGSLTGHLSGQMEREYSRRADQKMNAESAVLNWSRRPKP
ncbi:MAG: site-specific integrase [Rhizomicrobium sp.]